MHVCAASANHILSAIPYRYMFHIVEKLATKLGQLDGTLQKFAARQQKQNRDQHRNNICTNTPSAKNIAKSIYVYDN